MELWPQHRVVKMNVRTSSIVTYENYQEVCKQNNLTECGLKRYFDQNVVHSSDDKSSMFASVGMEQILE